MNKKLLLSSVVASLLLIGCGGGGGEKKIASNASNTLQKAYYIDSGVEGLDYSCDDKSTGITGKGGEFLFNKTTWCTFSIGGKKLNKLGVSFDGQKVFVTDANISSILLSLDSDANASNGIQISDKIKKAVKNSNSIDLNDLKTKGLIKKVYTKEEAREHLISITKQHFQSLKGKTVYYIDIDTNSGSPKYEIEELKFNKDLTAVSFEDEGNEETYTLEFSVGGVVYLKDNSNETLGTFTFIKSTNKYIEINKYDYEKNNGETIILYFNIEDAKKVLNNNSSKDNFTPVPITLDMLRGYKITYGSAWIEIDAIGSGSATLKDGRESGGGAAIIRNGNTLVVWPGEPFEYQIQFGSLPKVGTTVKVVKEGGKESYFSTITSMQKTK